MIPSEGYDLVFERRTLYLFARVNGPHDTLEISISYWTEIAEECARASIERLLVVEELDEKSTAVDMAQMIQLLPQMGFKDIRIAFVDRKEDIGMLTFAEVRALEVGIAGHVFCSVDAAERWLLSDLVTPRQTQSPSPPA